jgi:hypothetical protein
MIKNTLIIAVAISVAALAYYFITTNGFEPQRICKEVTLETIPSPDGQHIATINAWTCDTSAQAKNNYIRLSKARVTYTDKTPRTDSDVVFALNTEGLSATWVSASEIHITYPAQQHATALKKTWRGITVTSSAVGEVGTPPNTPKGSQQNPKRPPYGQPNGQPHGRPQEQPPVRQ